MSLATNKIILANAATNSAGAFFQAYSLGTSVTTATTVPAGIYYITPTANVTIELNKDTDGNISNASWAVVVANNTGGLFMSDGYNVRANVLNSNTVPSITLFATNGGQAVTGQYNNK
jgi:hypothetical protein